MIEVDFSDIVEDLEITDDLTVGDDVEVGGDLTVVAGDIDLVHADKKLLLPLKNDAANPTLAFGDGDSGFYEPVDNIIRVALNGITTYLFADTLFGSNQAKGPGMLNEDSSSTNPTLLSNREDNDTGIGHAANDALSLIAGGVEGHRITEAAGAITHVLTDNVGVTGDLDVTGNSILLGGQIIHKTDAGAGDYNPSILTTDYIITVDTTAAARSVIISTQDRDSGSLNNPRIFIIKDSAGNAGINNITISLETAGTIDGAATAIITGNYNAITIYIDGTNGYII